MTAAEPDLAVHTTGLTKDFGRQRVVDAIDLHVPAGSVYGFLGPNGSGKTTTIRMLLGLIRPSAGSASILGEPVGHGDARILGRVGSLVEGPGFHPYLSGRDNLIRIDAADLNANPATCRRRVDEALDRVGLSAAARKRYRAYSLGMRQRLGIAAALLQPRDLLVLDEPTNGLDPQGTREVRALLSDLNADGVSVLVSSHLLSEVEQICSHVGMMRTGELVSQGPLADVRGNAQPRITVLTSDPAGATTVLTERGVHDVAPSDGGVSGLIDDSHEPETLVAALVHAGVGIRGFEVARPALEDLFIAMTGEGFDVSG
ncbi:MAG: ATP-binding cassette domain-containing protein [Propionibacteriaceae bacterium]|nr:ATP-binding cassette domain-containing protein [Propionibacteriaceae bacterium]